MARPLRLEYSGAIHHVTSRGNAQAPIFLDDEDRASFLAVLAECIARFTWICHAYCLMDNHYHLIIETPDANLSAGMRQLNGVVHAALQSSSRACRAYFSGSFQGDSGGAQQLLAGVMPLRRAESRACEDGARCLAICVDQLSCDDGQPIIPPDGAHGIDNV